MADPIAERLRIVERDWDELRRQNNMLIEIHRALEKKLDAALKVLAAEADHLDEWARQSEAGGWSTHQVDPMRRRADELRRIAAELRSAAWAPADREDATR